MSNFFKTPLLCCALHKLCTAFHRGPGISNRAGRRRLRARGLSDSWYLELDQIEAREQRLRSQRASRRVCSNIEATIRQDVRQISATSSINRQQLPVHVDRHPGRKLRTSGSKVLITHSHQRHHHHLPLKGFERIGGLVLTRDIEGITAWVH